MLRNPAKKPKCPLASSGEIATTGRSRCRPITSATWRIGTPSSATACRLEPAGAFSNASLKRCATSSRCVAGQRLEPSPRYPETPVARAYLDQGGHEAVVALAVAGRWKSHDR